MNIGEQSMLEQDRTNALQRIAVALEELVGLGQVFVEATVMAAENDENDGEIEIMRCP